MRVAGLDLSQASAVAGGDIARAFHGRIGDREVFAKTLPGAPGDFFTAEERGLERLRVPGGPPVPEVLAAASDGLVIDWIPPGRPTRDAAVGFGRALARLHGAGGPTFGAAADGFIATLRLDNRAASSWPEFYAEQRLRPLVREARNRNAIDRDQAMVIEALLARIALICGPVEPPSRIHGDLWAGNLHWGADGAVWLVDAASAHDGHRETDLAMLHLFGAPHLDDIVGAYQDESPLADGWRERVPLHQLFPLLVHAVLFGGGYGARAASAARRLR